MKKTVDSAVLDRALAELGSGEKVWSKTTLAERRVLLSRVHALTGRYAADWVRAATEIKSLDEDSPLLGEEWMSGPLALLQGLEALGDTLAALADGRSPLDGVKIDAAPGGRVAVPVLPFDTLDKLILNGFRADVWLRPGIDAGTARRRAGLAQLDPTATGGIGVVLGAGNIMSIPPLDVLYELFAHNRVVALKLNPITDPLLPVFEKIFAPFIDLGALRILRGGAAEGGYLVEHPAVAHVHMTGGTQTHDAIVWGPGAEGDKRRRSGRPLLDKPITSELGGVSPTIVVPGPWNDDDVKFQAEHVATSRLHNGGYNCIAVQVVVVSRDWEHKAKFLDELRAALRRAPQRDAYYPGSAGRVDAALKSYPGATEFGGRVLVENLPTSDSPLLRTEYFSPVLGVVELPGDGARFLAGAVEFANNELMGTLGANLLAHPDTLAELGPAFDDAIENLRYGTIAVNAWTGLAFGIARAAWGAYPGHTLADIQSGTGVVHNALLLDDVERTVVRGPFRPAPRALLSGMFTLSPKPPWFVTNRTAVATGRDLVEFYARRRYAKLLKIFYSALSG
ncbi:aldehyde dehydrogenase family protein [Nocardia sp. NPDC058379]|uniref:aldehyde dehydrogenase family protein n=1 Tax=unclassified Nocardia TaxID=2637762 RepID=UPI00364EF230